MLKLSRLTTQNHEFGWNQSNKSSCSSSRRKGTFLCGEGVLKCFMALYRSVGNTIVWEILKAVVYLSIYFRQMLCSCLGFRVMRSDTSSTRIFLMERDYSSTVVNHFQFTWKTNCNALQLFIFDWKHIIIVYSFEFISIRKFFFNQANCDKVSDPSITLMALRVVWRLGFSPHLRVLYLKMPMK